MSQMFCKNQHKYDSFRRIRKEHGRPKQRWGPRALTVSRGLTSVAWTGVVCDMSSRAGHAGLLPCVYSVKRTRRALRVVTALNDRRTAHMGGCGQMNSLETCTRYTPGILRATTKRNSVPVQPGTRYAPRTTVHYHMRIPGIPVDSREQIEARHQ